MERTLGPGGRSTLVPQLFHRPFLDLICELYKLIGLTVSAELNALSVACLVEEHDPVTPLFEERSQSRRPL
jgi:hypothetical protein